MKEFNKVLDLSKELNKDIVEVSNKDPVIISERKVKKRGRPRKDVDVDVILKKVGRPLGSRKVLTDDEMVTKVGSEARSKSKSEVSLVANILNDKDVELFIRSRVKEAKANYLGVAVKLTLLEKKALDKVSLAISLSKESPELGAISRSVESQSMETKESLDRIECGTMENTIYNNDDDNNNNKDLEKMGIDDPKNMNIIEATMLEQGTDVVISSEERNDELAYQGIGDGDGDGQKDGDGSNDSVKAGLSESLKQDEVEVESNEVESNEVTPSKKIEEAWITNNNNKENENEIIYTGTNASIDTNSNNNNDTNSSIPVTNEDGGATVNTDSNSNSNADVDVKDGIVGDEEYGAYERDEDGDVDVDVEEWEGYGGEGEDGEGEGETIDGVDIDDIGNIICHDDDDNDYELDYDINIKRDSDVTVEGGITSLIESKGADDANNNIDGIIGKGCVYEEEAASGDAGGDDADDNDEEENVDEKVNDNVMKGSEDGGVRRSKSDWEWSS